MLVLQRTLPEGVLAGLATGQYSLHGGVVRNAAGQIVRHLVPVLSPALDPFGAISAVPSLYNVYQLHQLKGMTQALTQIAQTTMLLSGLNLAISVAGFAALNDGLRRVEKRLEQLDKKVKWIQAFLTVEQRAKLLHAVEQLSNLPSDQKNSFQILHTTRVALGQSRISYLQHWDQSEDTEEFMYYQHYFCTAFLAQARCSAELEMHEIALGEYQSGMTQWHERTRGFAADKILRKDRSRFLYNKGVEEIPAAKIAAWMDFAYAEQRGYQWIDVLRSEFDKSSTGVVLPWHGKRQRDELSQHVVFLDNLTSRSSVLYGYEPQLRFLAEHKLKPSQLDAEMEPLRRQEGGSDILILAPAIGGDVIPFNPTDEESFPDEPDGPLPPEKVHIPRGSKIGEDELLRHLNEVQKRNERKSPAHGQEPFVGLSWFVKTHLAPFGYDIGHSYGLINALEKTGRVETYALDNPKGGHPVTAVRTTSSIASTTSTDSSKG